MKALSWNVNGFRAVLKKWFLDYLADENPDIIGLQEVKSNIDQIPQKDRDAIEALWYNIYWNPAQRPGYSGTAILSKKEPINVFSGFLDATHDNPVVWEDNEWRILTAEYEDFYFTTVYTPNAKDDLSRLPLRYEVWDNAYKDFLQELATKKSVVSCGDFNVAHQPIDLARPQPNIGKKWFTDEEREWFWKFLDTGFIDSYRSQYPDKQDAYSWWSYMWWARSRNVGWRIDYFLLSEDLQDALQDAFIRNEILGSDHCPVWVEINVL